MIIWYIGIEGVKLELYTTSLLNLISIENTLIQYVRNPRKPQYGYMSAEGYTILFLFFFFLIQYINFILA